MNCSVSLVCISSFELTCSVLASCPPKTESIGCSVPGVFTDLESGVMYCCKEHGCGSMPKDFYEDVPGYDARAKLYPTLIPVVRQLLEQLHQERVNVEHWKRVSARQGPQTELQAHVLHCEWAAARRERIVEKLLDVLWLSRSPSA